MKLRSLLIITGLLLNMAAIAQNFSEGKFIEEGTDSYIWKVLRGQSFTYDHSFCYFLQESILGQITSENGKIQNDFLIELCRFEPTETDMPSYMVCTKHIRLKGEGRWDRNVFRKHIELPSISGDMRFYQNTVPSVYIADSRYGSYYFSENNFVKEGYDSFAKQLEFKRTRLEAISLFSNNFEADTAKIVVSDSNIGAFRAADNRAKVMQLSFLRDTIGYVEILGDGSTGVTQSEIGVNRTNITTIDFVNCHLTDQTSNMIEGSPFPRIGKMKFEKCSFTSNAWMHNIIADTVEFKRCIQFGIGFVMAPFPDTEPIVLKFNYTDLTNLEFDYTDQFQLYHWPNADQTRGVFEQLLIKFKRESKYESYKRVDIEYFEFQHNCLVNFLNLIWWNYGYNKWLIIYWTLFFLVIFTIMNVAWWSKLNGIYRVGKASEITVEQSWLTRFVKVFVYTALIFFSLRVDFDKLSFKSAGWLMYFFFQFVVGLLCLFFIANAILQL